jgi:hypothetical protein
VVPRFHSQLIHQVSAEELIKAIKLLNVDMYAAVAADFTTCHSSFRLPEEADDVLEYIKGDDGRVT